MNSIKETNNFKTILNENKEIYIEKEYSDGVKGYEYFEQVNNQIVYEAKTHDEFINIENDIVYTKEKNNEIKLNISLGNNKNDLPLIINSLYYKNDVLSYTPKIDNKFIILTTSRKENNNKIIKTFYFNKKTYYLNKIIEETFNKKNKLINSVKSSISYGKKFYRSRDAIIEAEGQNTIDLYLINNEEITKQVKASNNCKYITATDWENENHHYKLSFDSSENTNDEVISLENKHDNQVLIYVNE
jgi:hypothetical protein